VHNRLFPIIFHTALLFSKFLNLYYKIPISGLTIFQAVLFF
jgi:hypothetical protein